MGLITPPDGWERRSPRPAGGWQPLPPLRSQTPAAGQNTADPLQYTYQPQPEQTHRYLQCKICDTGVLSPKKKFRMSGPAVVIGFILLIPSIAGILLSISLFFGSLGLGSASSVASIQETHRNAVRTMRQARVPATVISGVVAGNNDVITEWLDSDYGGGGPPPEYQQRAVSNAQAALNAGRLGASGGMLGGMFASGVAIGMGIASFVGGLLGWLLVMRKRVLQCGLCGAVVNAS